MSSTCVQFFSFFYLYIQSLKTNPEITVSDGGAQADPIVNIGLSAKSWTCIADIIPSSTPGETARLAERTMEKMIQFALKDAKGAVVIEPIPDQLIEQNGQEIRTYSDEGHRAQLRATPGATRRAKSSGHHLVVSFASENQDVLARLESIGSKRT